MSTARFQFEYDVYNDTSELPEADALLLKKAREVTSLSYAPYSNFHVGAAARLINNEIVTGSNQENASYPVGICAERVLLGNAAMLFPEKGIQTLAISYRSKDLKSDHPISPCGMCRQALQEFEMRTAQPMRIILSGQEGKIFVIQTAAHLLPFAFTGNELG